MKEKKSISRSIRMTPTVYDIVNKFDGDGFNEKFEKLVLFCFSEEQRIRDSIAAQKKRYSQLIDHKTQEVERLDKLIEAKGSVVTDLEKIIVGAKDLQSIIKKVTSGYK